MRATKRFLTVGLTASCLMVTGPAAAMSATTSEDPIGVQYSNSCAGVYHKYSGGFVFGTVVNNCAYTSIHVRTDWVFAPDGSCTVLGPRKSYTEVRTQPSYIRDVVSC